MKHTMLVFSWRVTYTMYTYVCQGYTVALKVRGAAYVHCVHLHTCIHVYVYELACIILTNNLHLLCTLPTDSLSCKVLTTAVFRKASGR